MPIHEANQLEFNRENNFMGITRIRLYDVNSCLAPDLEEDDILTMVNDLAGLWQRGPGRTLQDLDIGIPMGMFIPTVNYQAVTHIFTTLGLFRHARNVMRSFTGITCHANPTQHGRFFVNEMNIYVHCDF